MGKLEKQLEDTFSILERLEHLLLQMGASDAFAQFFKVVIAVVLMAVIALLAYYASKYLFVRAMVGVSKRSKNRWDDVLVQKKFFTRMAHIAPAIIIYISIGIIFGDTHPIVTALVRGGCKIYLILIFLFLVGSFLDSADEMYQKLPFSKSRPIKGYLQVVKILVFFIGGIIILAILINKDPSAMIVGLGASSAVLMLVFKDTITGLVASIQLTANDMLKIGDWIEHPSRNIDGTVFEINLTTIKVKNFDNTTSTVPPIALVSESFINWRGMQESDGRRIKRSITIDVKTVKFCTSEMLERYRKIGLVAEYVDYLAGLKPIEGTAGEVNDIATNLNIFRQYVLEYLKVHPKVNKDAPTTARIREIDQHGIPLEIYCFCFEKTLIPYEVVQADILNHVIAAIDTFDLKIYQRMSSTDFRDTVTSRC